MPLTSPALVAMDPASTLSSDLQVSYVDVAFLTLLTYDTLFNVDREYRHIWRSKWGVVKILYLWTRYSTFIDTVLAVQKRLNGDLDQSSCRALTNFTTIFAGFGIGITEIILMIRTYALYGGSKKLLVFFLIMWFSIAGFNTWAVIKWTESFKFEVAPNSNSCDLSSSSNIGLVCYVSLIAGETAIVLLTLWKGLHTFSLSGTVFRCSGLVASFYRDGILFYLVMLLIFIVDVVLQRVAPPALKFIADTPLRVIHSISACHLVIHVRATASEESQGPMAAKSSLVFANLSAGSWRGVDTIV
ncbi:hypothetical protein DFH09DRAFT_1159700 [Mycena vulgaris]|nr:hypothetical protein DFH09DRAFT_1159700 [Mycena vulgaris]